MSPSVPNPPTPSHLFRVKAKVLNAPKAPLHLPMRLISLTSSPLTHSQPCWPPRSHTRAHTHTHAWWPPRLLSPPPGMLFFRSPLGSVPHHLQISTQMSPPQQGPSPPAHFKYHPLPQLSQFLSSSSIYHKTLYTHTHTHTHTHTYIFFFGCAVQHGIPVPQPGIEPTAPALETRVLTTGLPGKFLSTGLNTAGWTTSSLCSPPGSSH